jgi:hypothetical protein
MVFGLFGFDPLGIRAKFDSFAMGAKIALGLGFIATCVLVYYLVIRKKSEKKPEKFEDSVTTRGLSANQFADASQRR